MTFERGFYLYVTLAWPVYWLYIVWCLFKFCFNTNNQGNYYIACNIFRNIGKSTKRFVLVNQNTTHLYIKHIKQNT